MHPWRAQEGIWFDAVDSTNSWLKEQSPSIGSWVGALMQTAGRGRGDHAWSSPQGGLYMSVLIPKRFCLLAQSLAAGVAVVEVCRQVSVPAEVKWPNDICFEGRKLGGLLLEVVEAGVVLGIGLNLKDPNYPQALGVDRWTDSLDAKVWCQRILEELPRWTDPAIKVREIEEAWLRFWSGACRDWEEGQHKIRGRMIDIDLVNDKVCIYANSEKKWVSASQLTEHWPLN